MRQTIEYLRVGKDLTVQVAEGVVEQSDEPPPGFGHFVTLLSSPCGSDIRPTGPVNVNNRSWFYAPKGRFHQILESDWLGFNAERNNRFGYKLRLEEMVNLLGHTMHHEGLLAAREVAQDDSQGPIEIGAIVPLISGGEIVGAAYGIVGWDPNELAPGDLVVAHGAWRCPRHRIINPETGFADPCHRNREDGHTPKAVPGHGEMVGLSVSSEEGLPYPVTAVAKVPGSLVQWAEEEPERRFPLLEQGEVVGCVLEALLPMVMAEEKPEVMLVLGDGRAAAEIVLFATHMWPDMEIYFTGRTPGKMEAIAAIRPEKISPVPVGQDNEDRYGAKAVKSVLGRRQADVVIPTFPVESLKDFQNLVHPGARVIIWPACHTPADEHDRYTVVGNPAKLHPSYGGKFGFENAALRWLEEILRCHPERLEAFSQFPFQLVPFSQAAEPVEQLVQMGRYPVEMDGRLTSGNVIIDHGLRKIL